METATTKLQQDIIFRSKLPDIDIPMHLSLHSYCFQNISQFSTRRCLINSATNAVYTYEETELTTRKLAAGLTELGLRQGDAVMLLLPNSPEFVFSFLAASYARAVVALANPFYTPAEIAEASNARVIITQSSDVEKVRRYAEEKGGMVLCVDAPPSPDCLSFLDLISTGEGEFPAVKINTDDVAAVPYSSGTMGPPKAVMVTHKGLVTAVVQIVDGENPNLYVHAGDVLLSVSPFFHIYGLLLLLWAIRVGSGTVIMQEFDVVRFVEVIEKYKVTIVPFLPPMALAIVKSPVVDKYDLSSVRTVVCGAAPLGKELEEAVRFKFPNAKLGQAYGMTEGCAVAMSLAFAKEPSEFKSGGCGTVVRNAEMKIVDVETNQPGEVCIRGDQIMKGYLNNPDATERKIDKQGWLHNHTGDIGFVDDDTEIFIVDRIIEMIKYKEFLVAPAELEDLLLTHPCISEAAVISMKDEEVGEVPVAFVVKTKGSTITEDEIKEFISKQVVFHKRINRVFLVDVIHSQDSISQNIEKGFEGKIGRFSSLNLNSICKCFWKHVICFSILANLILLLYIS